MQTDTELGAIISSMEILYTSLWEVGKWLGLLMEASSRLSCRCSQSLGDSESFPDPSYRYVVSSSCREVTRQGKARHGHEEARKRGSDEGRHKGTRWWSPMRLGKIMVGGAERGYRFWEHHGFLSSSLIKFDGSLGKKIPEHRKVKRRQIKPIMYFSDEYPSANKKI